MGHALEIMRDWWGQSRHEAEFQDKEGGRGQWRCEQILREVGGDRAEARKRCQLLRRKLKRVTLRDRVMGQVRVQTHPSSLPSFFLRGRAGKGARRGKGPRGRLCTEHGAHCRARLQDFEPMTHAETKSQILKWLSHPGTPAAPPPVFKRFYLFI